jgi:hypothetical protein
VAGERDGLQTFIRDKYGTALFIHCYVSWMCFEV